MCIFRLGRYLFFVTLLLLTSLLFAHADGDVIPQFPPGGIEEHLGTKIPLDITFRDETGKTVALAELITGPTIILPVYYRCANVCSVLQARMATALQKLEQKPGEEYRVISISFDERETPELAARSKQAYLAAIRKPFPAEGWRFLTGDSTSIHRLTDSAGYFFQRQGEDFIHPVVSIMVAGDGTIVRYLYGFAVLPKDLALAITEARSGVAGTSIRKMMDFCFTYDPVGKTYVFNLLRVSATVVIICTGAFMVFLILGRKRKNSSR